MSNKKRDKIRVNAKRKKLIDMFGGKCSLCGKTHTVYDLHHVDSETKDFTIGMKDLRFSKLLKEAAKCILVCKNCHRELHSPYDVENLTTKQINKNLLLEYANTNKCEKCGYNKNIGALEFHHTDESNKSFDVSNATIQLEGMIVEGIVSDSARREIDKCIVLCSQCHAEMHYDFEFHGKYETDIQNKSENIREIQPKIDRELVNSLFQSGLRVVDIAKHLNASKGTICDILKSFGLTTSMAEIVENKKKKAIEKALTKPARVAEKIKKQVERRKFNPTYEEAIALRKEMTCREIGVLFRVSHVAVYKRFVKMGIISKSE